MYKSVNSKISMDLTGELAKVSMTWWDKELWKKPHLYKQNVDDINTVVDEVESGEEEKSQGDQRTFKAIQTAGNEIHSSIQLTYDTPSENADQKVPILDLECWMKQIEDSEGNKQFKVVHEFYIFQSSDPQICSTLAE